MAKETNTEEKLPENFRWDDLKGQKKENHLNFYKKLLTRLGKHDSYLVKEIFANARSLIKRTETLSSLIDEIDKLDWYSATREGLGDLYEGLLAKNATDGKSGAGQYFTPRPLIDGMVAVMKPTLDDVIQDPAVGTGGFLVAANHYICEHSNLRSWTKAQQHKYRSNTFYGMEHVHDVYRMALMNLMLHGIDSDPQGAGIRYGDTLSSEGEKLPKATLILSNPPFGTKKGVGAPTRKFPFPTSNKQLCFLQHIYCNLLPGGRAAVVMPDNVLFEGNTGKQIRVDLMDKCNLHTILRLPTGIFYAQGVKTNVLFFTRCETDKGNTKEVWVYDLRAIAPPFGKRTRLNRAYFTAFESAFGDDPFGSVKSLKKRKDTGEAGRFRHFTREWIAGRGDSLDISWLKDEGNGSTDELPEPVMLAQEAMGELEAAMEELRSILAELGEEMEA